MVVDVKVVVVLQYFCLLADEHSANVFEMNLCVGWLLICVRREKMWFQWTLHIEPGLTTIFKDFCHTFLHLISTCSLHFINNETFSLSLFFLFLFLFSLLNSSAVYPKVLATSTINIPLFFLSLWWIVQPTDSPILWATNDFIL